MLDLLRRKAQSTTIQITILIIVLVFVFWGVGTNRGNRANTVASVNGEPISLQEYQKAYEQTITQFRQQFGGTLPEGLIETFGIKQQVLNRLIQQRLIDEGARDVGLTVSQEEVRNTILKMGAFQTNGVFDMKRYEDILASSRIGQADFEAGIRSDLLKKKIIAHLSRFAHVPAAELKASFLSENEEVKVEYVSFAAENFKKKVKPSEEQLTVFFDKHKDEYMTAPQVKLKYITFPYQDVKVDSQFSAEDIERYYQQHRDRYIIPEKRRARHILIRTGESDSEESIAAKRKTMEEILKKARAGDDFATLAKEFSEDPGSAAQGGDLGFFTRGQMVKPFEDAAFALKKGEVSDIVRTPFGFHIIKLEAIQPAQTTSIDKARGEIIDALRQQKRKSEAAQLAQQAYESIILAGSLENYAREADATVRETGFFSQAAPPKELADMPALVSTAFTLKKGELSSLIETADGYAIIYVEDVKKPEVPPFAEVRKRVEQNFIAQRARELAEETAAQMLGELKDGSNFQAAAQKHDAQVKESAFFSRANQTAAGLPAGVVDKTFGLTAERPYPAAPVASGANFYVFRFAGKRQPPQALFAEKKPELRETLLKEKQSELVAAWVDFLKSRAKITINQEFFQ